MKTLYLTAALAAVLAIPSAAQQGTATTATSPAASKSNAQLSDQTFVMKVGISNQFEIQTSQLADQKAQSADVKRFAAQMIADHQKAGSELKSLVGDMQGKKLSVPSELDQDHATKLQQLQAASGPNFDRMYKQMQVEAHQEAVSLFTAYSQQGDDAQLKSWASKTLPTLKQHLQHAQNLQAGEATGSIRQ